MDASKGETFRHLLNSNRHFKDYRKAKPEAKLSEFISIFMGFAHRTTILEVIDEVNRRLQTGSKKDYFDDPVIMITKNEKRSFLELMDTKLYTKVRPSTPLKDVPLEALPSSLRL